MMFLDQSMIVLIPDGICADQITLVYPDYVTSQVCWKAAVARVNHVYSRPFNMQIKGK